MMIYFNINIWLSKLKQNLMVKKMFEIFTKLKPQKQFKLSNDLFAEEK